MSAAEVIHTQVSVFVITTFRTICFPVMFKMLCIISATELHKIELNIRTRCKFLSLIFFVLFRVWWRGLSTSRWSAPLMAWCPVCTPTPRTITPTSRPCVRWPSRESEPSPQWPSPLRHPSWTNWNPKVSSACSSSHKSNDNRQETETDYSNATRFSSESHGLSREQKGRPFT